MDIQSAREAIELPGRIIFLCASTMESARILFNSATREFPDGLANSSGQLGRNLMDHVYQVGASGTLDGNEDKMPMGNRPNGIYMPRFRNVTEKHPEFLRGYGCQGGGHRDGWDPGLTMADFGAHFKHTLRRPGPWKFGFGGFAECLPHPDNRALIDKGKPDAWGVPTLRISCTWRENEVALTKDLARTAAEILEAAGAKNITLNKNPSPSGVGIHEMGSAHGQRSEDCGAQCA